MPSPRDSTRAELGHEILPFLLGDAGSHTSLGRSRVRPPFFFAFFFYDETASYYSARTVNEKSPSPFWVRGFPIVNYS